MRRVVPRHPHERRRVGGRDALQHVHHHLVIDHAVLHVDDQRVPAGIGHDLGREARRDAEPRIDDGLSRRPQFPHSIRARHGFLLMWTNSEGDPASLGWPSQAGAAPWLLIQRIYSHARPERLTFWAPSYTWISAK